MSKLDLAYMAGVFDGEGSIMISKQKPGASNGSISPSYYLRVSLGITDRWICELFRFNFGGSIYKKIYRGEKYFPAWVWNLSGERAIRFLKVLLPYFHLKKAQAELGIKFQQGKRHFSYGRRKKPVEASVLEEADYILMKALKREKINE